MAVELARWWLATTAMTLAAWPLCHALLGRLDDRGWSLARVFGPWLVGLAHWLAWAYGPWPSGWALAWGALALVAVGGWAWVGWAGVNRAFGWLARRWRLALGLEALYLAGFLAWAWLRSLNPAANHTEQPMDMMHLQALWGGGGYPAQDAWLAGRAIGYYYFGHWQMSHAAHLAGLWPWTAYNLGQAGCFAACLCGAFGLARAGALAARSGPERALVAGVLAALATCLSANIKGALMALGAWPAGDGGWWWFQATRVIEDALAGGRRAWLIDEFPFFSFYLGDNHAHVLALPLALLTLALTLNALSAPRGRVVTDGLAAAWRACAATLSPLAGGWFLALAAPGSLLAANTWDCAGLWPLLVLAVAAASPGGLARRARQAALAGGGLIVVAALVHLPYLVTAQSQGLGLAANAMAFSGAGPLLAALGPPLAAGLAALAVAWAWLRPRAAHLIVGLALAVGAPLAVLLGGAVDAGHWPGAPWGLLLIGPLLAVAAALAWRWLSAAQELDLPPGLGLCLLMALLGLALALAPEIVVVRDAFASRMNTAFKFHYQAWLLLALAGAIAVATAQNRLAVIAAGVWAALALLGLAYPAKLVGHDLALAPPPQARTLDAAHWLSVADPDALAVIGWLRENSAPGDVVAQAPGRVYQALDNAVSTFGGRAAPLGWVGHQHQWRGGDPLIARREALLHALYAAADQAAFGRTMDALGARFVLVGPRERQVYGLGAGDGAPGRWGKLVFQAGRARLHAWPVTAEEGP
ncbi:YYY membrane protein [Desulfarculus baarsii DSM 2075]|uniref:YYY membrane protein n=1 Tax=Desulfarculus baarsii (strain ATCC 33931 / DSM 2075 / LMG 7858 / VKM B-1802 / 2st14) TaxID=644282 RepID=E1QMI0_DESB2|nr:DUF2298 domain-containing protein [Desulfarculus baarsii]ADK86223.1 YYY membrane protein [Desulfarculus baarsii DSM 2075]